MIPSSFTQLVKTTTNYKGRPVRNGKLTKAYKKYVKETNGVAPLPNTLAYNPNTKRIVKYSSVYDSRFKNKKVYKTKVKKEIIKRDKFTHTETVLDALNNFRLYRYNVKSKTLKELFNVIKHIQNTKHNGEGFVRLYFKNIADNKISNRNISNEYLDSYEEFKARVEEIQEGVSIGSDSLDESTYKLLSNIFDLFITKIGGGSKADSIIWNCKNIVTKYDTCYEEVLKSLGGSKADIKNIDSNNKYFDNLIKSIDEITKITGETVQIIANSFTIDGEAGASNIKSNTPTIFTVPNGKKKDKLIKSNQLLLSEYPEIKKVVLFNNQELKNQYFLSDDEDIKIDHTIIYDKIQGHYDLVEGDLEFNNIYLGRNNTIYRKKEDDFKPLYRFNDLNKMNKTNKQMTNKKIFFDYETVIDTTQKNIMKEYSISFLVLDDDELATLEKLDAKGNIGPINKFLEGKIFNFVGYDCSIRFVKWILENQYIKHEESEEFVKFDLVSFNGANFDNFILLHSLLDLDNDFGQEINVSQIFYNGSQILNMKINNKHSVFDIAKHLVGSLKGNCKGFNVKTLAKGEFNHHTAQKLHDDGKLIEFMTDNKELETYNNLDVLSLAVIFERYKNALRENEETKDYADDLCNRKTIGGLIYDIAKKSWKNLKIDQDEIVDKKTIRKSKSPAFPKLDKKEYDDILKFKCAGRVELFNGVQKIEEELSSKDVCSLYPFIMAVFSGGWFPCGIKKETIEYIKNKIGFYYCDIDQSNLKNKNLPNIYPEKVFKKKANGAEGPLEGNDWASTNILKDYLISNVMIEQLLKNGCKVNIKNGFYFTDRVRGCDLFEFILVFMKKKNEQDLLKKGKSDLYNSALRETLKLLMNSMSGKVIEGLHLEKTIQTDEYDYLKIKDDKKTESITCINIIGSKVFTTYKVSEESQINKQRPVYLGVLIYDYSKCYMFDTLYSVIGLKDLVYTDTDAGKMRKSVFNRPDVKEYMRTAKISAWNKAIKYDPKLKNHLLYDENSKVFGSYEEECAPNNLSYFLQKKGYLIINKEGYEKGEDDSLKMGFKGVPKTSVMITLKEDFIEKKTTNHKDGTTTTKYFINDNKKANDYYNENKNLQIQNNAIDFGEQLYNNKFCYILTMSFRKVVKNTLSNVETDDIDRFNKLNNTIQVSAILKKITIN